MGRQHHKTDHFARHALLQQIAHGKEITQRFGHLFAFDLQHLVVHPDVGHAIRFIGAAALSDLVFMMRKHQIIAAAVNVEGFAQQFLCHGRAFDVPARAPVTPGALPPRQILARGLPEHEIHRVALVGRHLNPRAGNHVIDRTTREAAIAFLPAFHRKQHMTLRNISVALPDQRFDHRDHLRNIFRCTWHVVRLHRTQRFCVFQIPGDRLIGALADQRFQRSGRAGVFSTLRLGIYLVVHIRKITHVGHMIRPVNVPQQAEEHVKDNHRTRVAEVRPVIDSRPADVHAHIIGVDRRKRLFPACAGVIKRNSGHELRPCAASARA